MSKKGWSDVDAAGWLFWAGTFLVMAGPCIYGAWRIPYTSKSPLYPLGIGTVGAAVGAGFVSWAVNEVLQRRQRKVRNTQRKKSKKQK